MANGHGGARIGAGQKKKALSDKLAEGNPGKRKLTVMEFSDTADLEGEQMPPPREYLAAQQKSGRELLAVEIYERTWEWLHERGCSQLIPAQIIEQCAERHGKAAPYGTGNFQDAGRKINFLVDIQAKLQAGKGKGYERWARVFNLKEASKTVNFLTENNVADYEELEARTEAAGKRFDFLSARIKQLEGQMAEKAQMKMHIINYAKTRDVYAAYKKSRYRESFRNQHLEEIRKHEAAKAAFDALGGKAIPKVAELSKKYAALLAEKKQCYEEYKAARQEMIEYQTAKRNVDMILGMEEDTREKQRDRNQAEH